MPAESDAAPPTPPPFSPFQPLDASYLQHAPTPLSPYSRVIRKVKEEPVVFAFLGLTVGALVGGLSAMGRADARQSQLWMRARVFFQFCTVSALVGSIYVQAVKDAQRSAAAPPAAASMAAVVAAPVSSSLAAGEAPLR